MYVRQYMYTCVPIHVYVCQCMYLSCVINNSGKVIILNNTAPVFPAFQSEHIATHLAHDSNSVYRIQLHEIVDV